MTTIVVPRAFGGTLFIAIVPPPTSIVPNIMLAVRQGSIAVKVRQV